MNSGLEIREMFIEWKVKFQCLRENIVCFCLGRAQARIHVKLSDKISQWQWVIGNATLSEAYDAHSKN